MHNRRGSDLVYRNGLMVGIVAIFWFGFAIAAITILVDDSDVGLPFLVFGLPVLTGYTYLLAIRPRVILRRHEVQVYGYGPGSDVVQYPAIRGVGFTGRFAGLRWLRIHTRSGTIVGVHPLMASSFPFVEPLWQRELAEELTRRAGLDNQDTTRS
ncbi:MAG: hypothetical protein GY720_07755 [bacterium]|nr:hypothetical protein [bacterium]